MGVWEAGWGHTSEVESFFFVKNRPFLLLSLRRAILFFHFISCSVRSPTVLWERLICGNFLWGIRGGMGGILGGEVGTIRLLCVCTRVCTFEMPGKLSRVESVIYILDGGCLDWTDRQTEGRLNETLLPRNEGAILPNMKIIDCSPLGSSRLHRKVRTCLKSVFCTLLHGLIWAF